MYVVLFTILILIAGTILIRGITRKKTVPIITGGILGLLTIGLFWFMGFWGEMLWFDQLGYDERFWKLWLAKIGLFIGAFIINSGVVYLFTYSLKGNNRLTRWIASAFGGVVGGMIWLSNWDVFLKYINKIETSVTDPILNMPTSFYLFEYPFYLSVYNMLLYAILIAVGANLFGMFEKSSSSQNSFELRNNVPSMHSIFTSVGAGLIILGLSKILRRFGLLFSQQGVVQGPGWTDEKIRLPLLALVTFVTILMGVVMFIPGLRQKINQKVFRSKGSPESAIYYFPGAMVVIWIVFLAAIPLLFQWLRVEPNEITVEKPYIENNIEFTRAGFHLNKVEVKEFPAKEEFSREDIRQNQNIFSNIRLWDYRALDAVFKQFQEIRLYYEFADVDIDRYIIDSTYREVMISAREMKPDNLPANSQTFINKRFKYTHGYGAVLTQVSEFTEEGLPNLLIKDIPPVSKYPELEITRPEIYYGELTDNYVVVNTKEKEFDYPSGENNIYASYEGDGGVQISNFWRKLLYGWKMGGTRFLLSSYPTEDSRIMFHRQIVDRVKALAPFLYFDDDPYIVKSNGELMWILDAYTVSKFYPYSEPFSSVERIGSNENLDGEGIYNLVGNNLHGKNYIRNSVKITINAYNGEVDFYIFEEEDPIIQVYNKIFPGLLKPRSEMPAVLQKHIRYPADMLLVQGLMYTKYHMTDPTVFYNQEDLWVRATEKYYSNVQPVEPYYIMWEHPESDETEFVLMLPFTPKNKQVMIGWIAGMCDDENYGRFLAYKFPKEKRVLGTQQVETKIDQDSYLSGQLTLWDQRGSNVIRGNVLAIPVDETIIYVEPIYLKSQTAAYPELRLVAVMHNDRLSYAETFDEALNKLFLPEAEQQTEISDKASLGQQPDENVNELIERANRAFEEYVNYTRDKNFTEAGRSMEELERTLQQLSEKNE